MTSAAWRWLSCYLAGHEKRHRALTYEGVLYTWVLCRRCGRHLSGQQPPWHEMLQRAANKRLVAL